MGTTYSRRRTHAGLAVRRICQERGITLTEAAHEMGINDPANLHHAMSGRAGGKRGNQKTALAKWLARWKSVLPAGLKGLAVFKEGASG